MTTRARKNRGDMERFMVGKERSKAETSAGSRSEGEGRK